MVAVCFMLVGLGLLTAAIVITLQTRSFIADSVMAEAHVVALQSSRRSSYYTLFSFQDTTGTFHTNRSATAQAPPPFSVGSQITVLYPSSDPESARIKTFGSLWLVPTFLFGFGVAFLGGGSAALILGRKTYGSLEVE